MEGLIFYQNIRSMGSNFGCISGKSQTTRLTPKLQLTYLENIDNIQDCLTPHYFILDLACNQQIDTLTAVVQRNPSVKRFTSVSELKEFKEDHKNNVLLVCDEKQKYLKELLPNFTAFQKIAFAHADNLQDSKKVEQKLKFMYGYRFSGLISFDQENLDGFLTTQTSPRSVYFFNSDAGLINRALANIYFFVDREVQPSFQTFQQYLSHDNGEGRAIAAEIRRLLKQKPQMLEYFVKLLLENNPVINKAINLLKDTFNPGIIAHVSWFYETLQTYTRMSYIDLLPKLQLRQVFVVAQLTEEEIKLVSKGGNFMFSTFVIGYTSQEQAQKVRDQSANSYLFMIDLPKSLSKNLPKECFGFCVAQNRVIFALQTVFRVDKFKQRDIFATYGVLGKQLSLRRQEFRYINIAKQDNLNMLRCFDYLVYSKFFIKNQTDLLLHLQYYHKYKSLPRSQIPSNLSLINQPQSSVPNNSQSNINLSNISARSDFLPSLIFDQKLADVEAALGNIQTAQALYNNVAPTDRSHLKKTYMYDKWDKERQFFQTLQKLKQIQITDVFANRFLQIALMSYNAVMLAYKQQPKQAQKKMAESIKKLQDEFKVKFINKQNLHETSILSLPLYSILMKNNARAAKKINQHQLSKMYEDDYNQNWPFFDATHINWLP